ncbi:MAG: DUF438 domain-containing protein [Acidobacteria bacterium]|nr:DUF438 domain-containing protein [Acidobacteriota bacterium]
MSELIDNRANRIRTLREIIERLHGGESPDAVRESLRAIVKETDYSEIVAMEQQLIADGMAVEKIMSMCDLHSQVTRDVLVQLPPKAVAPGHPVDTMRRENAALSGALLAMKVAMRGLAAEGALFEWRKAFNDVMDVEKHYQRKENLLFTALEKHEITGPSKVMWGKDDEIRGVLKDLGVALHQQATVEEWQIVAATLGETVVTLMEEMIYKEENILLPLCLDHLTDDEWGQIWLDSPRYGWCLVEPQKGYAPPEAVVRAGVKLATSEAVQLPTGNLTVDQLVALFNALPVDLTFVDADDRVAFFSEGPDRIFARTKAIIGRKVQHCHPPRSVEVVDRILEDFRGGRQSVAEFWISLHGKFVHIRYFAVRGEGGEYLGTLEVTQEVSRIRALEGERRLLAYDEVRGGAQ